jgi:MFS family permease
LAARDAGLALMPVSLAFFVLSTQSGRLAQFLGLRAMTAGGTALIGSGLLIVATTQAGSPMLLAQCGLVLAGVGMGLNTGPLYGIAVGSVGRERSGTASAMINVARMTGATLGVALLGTVFGLFHGSAAGLRAAMLIGGIAQLCGALVAFANGPPMRLPTHINHPILPEVHTLREYWSANACHEWVTLRPIGRIRATPLSSLSLRSKADLMGKRYPSFEGPVLASADRLADAFSLRYPYVRQAPIDKQADGSRARVAVRGSPEFDAFEHLGREKGIESRSAAIRALVEEGLDRAEKHAAGAKRGRSK